MNPISAVLVALLLAGCAGGMPPSSSNGLNEFDVVFGFKEIPEGADNSHVWSPVHQIFAGKPTWSVVWFKQKTKNGVAYDLTATPHGESGQAALGKPAGNTSQITEAATLFIRDIKNWFNRLSDHDPV